MKKPGRVATIAGLAYRFPEGIATLYFKDGSSVFVESGIGLRALARCFGAREGGGDLLRKIRNRRIVYILDEFGVMVGFTPASRWKGPERA
jgi:hypothetical protein